MNTVPSTSERNYLTGRTALNIPTEEGDFADWHFTEAFLHPQSRFHIAGKNFPDTYDYLGDYGIRECADILRRSGAPVVPGQKVYAASYIRAILDLVLTSILEGHLPRHVAVNPLLDDEQDLQELDTRIAQLKQRIKDHTTLSLLDQWNQQRR